MKQDKNQSGLQPKLDQKTLQQLLLRKRVIDSQIEKIKQMQYHQLLDRDRKKQPIMPPSPTRNFYRQQLMQHFKNAGFEDDLEEITKKHMQIYQEAEKKKIIQRRQMREAPILNQIRRGKLGFDGILILFAIFGSITLPAIFYQRFKKNKQTIVKSRKYSPQFIENLTEDSEVNIDQVSDQSIHYDNPERRRKYRQFMQKSQKISALKRELDL